MKNRFLITGLALIFAIPAFAELTVDDTISQDYLKNHGYSNAIINTTQKLVAEHNGEPYTEPVENEMYNQPAIKFVRRLFMYLDPALDDHSFSNNHNINTTPRYDDL